MGAPIVCVDVGSTFTKASAIGADGSLVATAEHPTTVASDVLVGLDAAVAALGIGAVPDERIVACSSAGGGLRLAVVGYERVISAEAGRRVALSAGARVVAVTAGRLDQGAVASLTDARPDVILLVGGTDGGDAEVLLHNADALGRAALTVPVVVAGNVRVSAEADRLARGAADDAARPVIVADNVIPRIGTLAPASARRAIREVFISHVIGGKGLSVGPRFPSLVAAATPDAVLAGIEVVADVYGARRGGVGDVLAVDVGGATTDVYSVLEPPEGAPVDAVETAWHGRTVEGDLGMRWSAPDVLVAARAERLVLGAPEVTAPRGPAAEERGKQLLQVRQEVSPFVHQDVLAAAAQHRHDEVGFIPDSAPEVAVDLTLARLAAVVAVRRHARPGLEGVRDLSHVGLVIGSGGVLRHASDDDACGVLEAVLGDLGGGWRVPERARTMVDRRYLLAPIGLLWVSGHEAAARSLAEMLLVGLPQP